MRDIIESFMNKIKINAKIAQKQVVQMGKNMSPDHIVRMEYVKNRVKPEDMDQYFGE